MFPIRGAVAEGAFVAVGRESTAVFAVPCSKLYRKNTAPAAVSSDVNRTSSRNKVW